MKRIITFPFLVLAVTLPLTLSSCSDAPEQENPDSTPMGTKVDTLLHSPGLEGNLLGDKPDRQVIVYLPPGYEENPSRRYPVIYFLHGYTQDETFWLGSFTIPMNQKIGTGIINPMIAVFPDSKNRLKGSYYTNSMATGQWEDFIVQDVVRYVDNNFRTIASAEGRGISGHSMGGYGAFKLAMEHPDVYSTVYAMSIAPANLQKTVFEFGSEQLSQAVQLASFKEFKDTDYTIEFFVCLAATFAPNPDRPPFYGEFPITEEGTHIESSWQKWLAHDLYSLIPAYKDNLSGLRAIRFDCGTLDHPSVLQSNISFSEALDKEGVDHIFEEYEGDHTNHISERVSDIVLPFFSETLDHE